MKDPSITNVAAVSSLLPTAFTKVKSPTEDRFGRKYAQSSYPVSRSVPTDFRPGKERALSDVMEFAEVMLLRPPDTVCRRGTWRMTRSPSSVNDGRLRPPNRSALMIVMLGVKVYVTGYTSVLALARSFGSEICVSDGTSATCRFCSASRSGKLRTCSCGLEDTLMLKPPVKLVKPRISESVAMVS